MSKYEVISGPYLLVFNANTGKYGSEITLYLDTFHEVMVIEIVKSKLRLFDLLGDTFFNPSRPAYFRKLY